MSTKRMMDPGPQYNNCTNSHVLNQVCNSSMFSTLKYINP